MESGFPLATGNAETTFVTFVSPTSRSRLKRYPLALIGVEKYASIPKLFGKRITVEAPAREFRRLSGGAWLRGGERYKYHEWEEANHMGTYEETVMDIETSLGFVPGFMKALPAEVLVHDWPLMKKYTLGESKIPAKYRELIGLAIAANIKCPYCQLFHTGVAKLHGATDEELAEVYFLASFSSRWSAMIHAQHYDYATFEEEVHKIGAHLSK